tara:strand:+ start:1188 stop:1379 length:192 start_codon:yes stop_codon:yes gene_type:complete
MIVEDISDIVAGHMNLIEQGVLDQRLTNCRDGHIGPIVEYEMSGEEYSYCQHCYRDVELESWY